MEVDDILGYDKLVAAEKHSSNLQHPRFPRWGAGARLGTAARCNGADRPLHHRRRQRSLPGHGVSRSQVFRRAIAQLLV